MSSAHAAAVAISYFWLGMVAAISFLEAPLKFRASGVTLPIGLAIGRVVFRALNAVEVVLAVLLIAALAVGSPAAPAVTAAAVAILALAVQTLAVRPPLHRRSDAVLADPQDAALVATRSLAHQAYVALEVLKCVALLLTGILVAQ